MAWPSTGSYTAWSKCFKCTLQASKISGALAGYFLDLDDMPSAFWSAVQSDGDDIRFTEDDGETSIEHYQDFIDTGTGKGLVWVDCPHAGGAASVDVDVYLYVGNAGASSASTTSAMPATMQARYMLQEQPTSSTAIKDTSGNGRDSTSISGSMTSGDLETNSPHSGLHSIAFDTDDRATFASTLFDACESANAFTWSGWVHLNSNPAGGLGFFGSGGSQFHVGRDGISEELVVSIRNSANSANFTATSSTGGSGFPISTWIWLAVVYNGATLKGYINGSEVASASATSIRSASLNFYVGHNNTNYSRSNMAEVIIHSEALSADQISTYYANETDSAFWAISEHTGGGGGAAAGSFFFGG
jgi:hypothetical protein